jgi:two-component system, chemotaxis family, protein-glutamate methylesterase/glutaminase
MPENIPPTLVVQHIPAVFSKAFADRMNGLCPFTVSEAIDGEKVEAGHVYIAPGGKHMKLSKSGGDYKIVVTDDEPVNRFRPSVDYLFDSFGTCVHPNAVAVILTGMGRDGSKAMLRLKEKGVKTIAQDAKSCVVYGMPRAAVEIGAADHVCPLNDIPAKILELLN